jgi:hypothetical protein
LLPAPKTEAQNEAFVNRQNAPFLAKAEERERKYQEQKSAFDKAREAVGHNTALDAEGKVKEVPEVKLPTGSKEGTAEIQRGFQLRQLAREMREADKARERRQLRTRGKKRGKR